MGQILKQRLLGPAAEHVGHVSANALWSPLGNRTLPTATLTIMPRIQLQRVKNDRIIDGRDMYSSEPNTVLG